MIYLIGAGGFIGSNMGNLLTEKEIDFVTVDSKINLAVEDFKTKRTGVGDIVILLAADLNFDLNMYRNNLSIYNWLANNMKDAHFIYTSSAAVYGETTQVVSEKTPVNPYNLYGKSKLLGEQIIQDTKENYTILRLSNVYGNGEGNGAIDKFKSGGNNIYGHGYDIRDYVSVTTVTCAILNIMGNLEAHNKEIYNISTGEGTSTIAAFRKHGTGNPIFLDAREEDISYSVLDNKKAIKAGLICNART